MPKKKKGKLKHCYLNLCQKSGLSPLIATVLIIGFTVALGAVVMLWGGDT